MSTQKSPSKAVKKAVTAKNKPQAKKSAPAKPASKPAASKVVAAKGASVKKTVAKNIPIVAKKTAAPKISVKPSAAVPVKKGVTQPTKVAQPAVAAKTAKPAVALVQKQAQVVVKGKPDNQVNNKAATENSTKKGHEKKGSDQPSLLVLPSKTFDFERRLRLIRTRYAAVQMDIDSFTDESAEAETEE